MDIEINVTNKMQSNTTTSTKNIAKPIGIGERLRAAREAMNLSEKEAAARMHLNVKFIEIMENEDFENGPPATFMRGYLRSYARMINISQKEINDAIEELGMNVPSATSLSPTMQTLPTISLDRYVRFITYLIVFVLIALVGIWWSSRTNDTGASSPAVAPSTGTNANTTPPVNNSTSNNSTVNNNAITDGNNAANKNNEQPSQIGQPANSIANTASTVPAPSNSITNGTTSPQSTKPSSNTTTSNNAPGTSATNSTATNTNAQPSTPTVNLNQVDADHKRKIKSKSHSKHHKHRIHSEMHVPEPGLYAEPGFNQ